MKVSVIIAAYNIEKYIERCINSVINQTLREIEIIVVNDGSTDSTLNILNYIAYKDNRIKIIDKKNAGIIEARKSGYEVATGEYALFIDGDDWLEINTIEILYKKAKGGNSDIVCFNAFKSYDTHREKFLIVKDNISTKEEPLKTLLLNDILPAIWAKFIKLDFIKNNYIEFPSNISYGDDLATVANWFMHNPKVDYINIYLYNYYQRENSITKIASNKLLEVNDAINFIQGNLKKINIYKKYEKEFEYMIFIHLFIMIIISSNKFNDIHRQVYRQYKSRGINTNNNKYIIEYISSKSFSMKLRIKLYNFSFILGNLYDCLRNSIKK